MDQFEVEIKEKNFIGGIDRVVINLGVAIMAFIPTLFYLLVSPKKLAPLLSGDAEADGRSGMLLGPGIFFFLSVIFNISALKLMILDQVAEHSTRQTELTDTPAYQVGYSLGKAFSSIQNGIYENLASGNIWSAIVFAIPLFLIATFLGMFGGVVFRSVSEKWTYKVSMGAGLYTFGFWLFILLFLHILVFRIFNLENLLLIGALFISAFFASLVIMFWQYFWLATERTQADEGKIIPRALLMPFVFIGSLVTTILICF